MLLQLSETEKESGVSDIVGRLLNKKPPAFDFGEDHWRLRIEAADEIESLRQRVNELEKIEAAARNLIKVKGRHHTEQAMKVLIDAVNSQTF